MPQALDIDHCDLEITTNNKSHHTQRNGTDRLIVRRGQSFMVTLHLKPQSTPFTPGQTDFTLTVETGPLPRKESDTKVCFGLTAMSAPPLREWSASAMSGHSGNTVALSITSSTNAPIGRYSLTLDQDGQQISLGEFILLFNSWCPGDAVYMKSEEERQEYVLCQNGLIYKGTHKRIREAPWNFGQFEPGVLDICLKILDDNPKFVADADQDVSGRRNPIYVTRVLSAMINSNDDRGVLVGNWSGEYSDGVSPSHWISSVDILRQWAESGPVSYGQCWVFAAVECTVSRALGIPCRVVTNFGSAHDGNADLVIERLYDTDGERLDGDDSIWNFHVWVDSWMVRPDLEPQYNGWQASDPTPQETSDGVYCCGPVPLLAVKEGELTKKYDAPFVFAEVNADVVDLVQLPSGKVVQFSGSTKSVGNKISTKAVGKDRRHDITHEYKYPEGSEEERKVFKKAEHNNKLLKRGDEPGLKLKIKLADGMTVGSDFEVYAILKNNSDAAKTCTFIIIARAVTYNGKRGDKCGFASKTAELPADGEARLPLQLMYEKYGPAITVDKLIELQAFAIDDELDDFCKAEKILVLDDPVIQIQLLGEVTVNQPVTVEVSMVNPLPEAISDCSFTVGGIGLTRGETLTLTVGKVEAHQEAKAKVELTPSLAGKTVLMVSFESNKLGSVSGLMEVEVNE